MTPITNQTATALLEVLPDLADLARCVGAVAEEWIDSEAVLTTGHDAREARLVELAETYDRLLPALVTSVAHTANVLGGMTDAPWPSLRDRIRTLSTLDDCAHVTEALRIAAEGLAAVADNSAVHDADAVRDIAREALTQATAALPPSDDETQDQSEDA